MKWPQSIIRTRQGEKIAIEPYIISASRATDIPAFHVPWLLKRLAAGYCLWKNPFNPAQSQYVSFSKCRLVVFWSKNPAPLLPRLRQIEDMGLQFYFHFTLNDYAAENLEPGLPPLEARLETFRLLAERFGPDRVIWRFDPLILGGGIDVEGILARIEALAARILPHTKRLVFSFVDFYRKTKRNLGRLNPAYRPPTKEEAQILAAELVRRLAPLDVFSCAENLPGIRASSCIDPWLVKKLCPELATQILPAKVSASAQFSLLPLAGEPSREKLCGCIPAKDIGAYDSCAHGCVYCYACSSPASSRSKKVLRDVDSESL